jgi:hypothetical protein
VGKLKKRSKKKVFAYLVLLALLIGVFPEVQSDTFDTRPQPDYGIYNAMEDIQDEKTSRINSHEVLNETQGRFDNITVESGEERFDFTSGRETVTPDIPVPPMIGIFDAMMQWDVVNNNEITDWLLPPPIGSGSPLSYYIYTKYITNETIIEKWTNASLRPVIATPETLHLSQWWDVDVDNDAVDDIEVFFDPVLDWTWGYFLTELIERLANQEPIEVPITLHYDIGELDNTSFDIPGFENLEVYVAKSFSYNNQNFLLFLGLNFSEVLPYFNTSVSVSRVHLDNYSFTPTFPPQPPNLNIADLVALGGPYYLRWNSPTDEDLPEFALEVATARLEFTGNPFEPYDFINRSWVDIDFIGRGPFYRVPSFAELIVVADDELSSFDHIGWTAQHECDIKAKFFDSQENVTYAEIEIDKLVDEIEITMEVVEKNNQDVTIIDYDAPGGIINYIDIHHYEYFDTEYEDITKAKIDNGDIEYIHLFMNISHIPRKLYLEGVFYIEDVDDSPPLNPGFGMVEQFVDSLVLRVISRFTRIAKTLSSIPYKLLEIAEEGSFATVDTYGLDDIDKIEFIFTSGDYVTSYGNFIAFYNNTRSSSYPIAKISLSGRITKVSYFNASFEQDIKTEIEMMNNERLRALYVDDINSLYAVINISNVPKKITIQKTADTIQYDGFDDTIDELRFVSDYQGTYVDFKIFDLTDSLTAFYEEDRTFVSSGALDKPIGEIEFLVTTGPILRLSGNHLLLRQESNFSVISGRFNDISRLDYDSGFNGKLAVDFVKENTMNISLNDNRTEKISADLIIDPLPSSLSVNLTGLFFPDVGGINLPRLDTTGVLGFVHIIFGLAVMGNEIISVADDAMNTALTNIGNFVSALSFSYSTNNHITLIGKILRGDTYTLDDVDWMHGISVRQTKEGSKISMAAKLYLTGLPTSASISTFVFGDYISLNLYLINFAPKHNWLCLDVRGLQNRDVLIYINDLPESMDLDLHVAFASNLNLIPQMAIGTVSMDSNLGVGSIYGRMLQTVPDITVTEVFLSEAPRDVEAQFLLGGNISLDFSASQGIEYMFAKNTRKRDGEFHDVYMVLHEIPRELELNVAPVMDYDMDESLLQTLPTLNITSPEGSLDAYIFADGKGMGQVGIFEVQVVNLATEIEGEFKNDKYSIKSTGVDYLWIHALELPIMEGHETKSIELVGKDILSFDLKTGALFGNYPIIEVDNAKGGEIQVVIDHRAGDSKAGLALIDFETSGGIPQSPSILINGGSLNLDKGSSHVLVPAPILTMFLTLLS